MNTNSAHIAIAGVIVFALGVVITWLLFVDGGAGALPGPASAAPSVPGSEPAAAVGAVTERRSAAPVPSNVDAPHASPERQDGALFSAELQAFARTELERGWRELRQDDVPADVIERGLQDYEQQLMTRAHWFGRSEAERRNAGEKKAALFAGDDGVALLQAITGDEPEAKDYVASDRFATLFAGRGGGSAVDGTTLTQGAKVPDGATVSFPAGVFAVQDLGRGNNPYPVDLTLRGSGMDATLLVIDDQMPRGAMQRFAVEDCTVFADGLLDVRSGPSVVTLTRVRLVGFDCGAGGSVALDVRQVALRAVRCRFEGGYGRAPAHGASVLRTSGARLAQFDQCVFERVSLDDADSSSVLFVDCNFTDMLERQPEQPTFRNCRYNMIPRDKSRDAEYLRRDLNALFPQWQQFLQRR